MGQWMLYMLARLWCTHFAAEWNDTNNKRHFILVILQDSRWQGYSSDVETHPWTPWMLGRHQDDRCHNNHAWNMQSHFTTPIDMHSKTTFRLSQHPYTRCMPVRAIHKPTHLRRITTRQKNNYTGVLESSGDFYDTQVSRAPCAAWHSTLYPRRQGNGEKRTTNAEIYTWGVTSSTSSKWI